MSSHSGHRRGGVSNCFSSSHSACYPQPLAWCLGARPMFSRRVKELFRELQNCGHDSCSVDSPLPPTPRRSPYSSNYCPRSFAIRPQMSKALEERHHHISTSLRLNGQLHNVPILFCFSSRRSLACLCLSSDLKFPSMAAREKT